MAQDLDEGLLQFMTDPAARLDPYPFYARMRQEDPVHWSPALGFWFVTSHSGASALARDRRWSNSPQTATGAPDMSSQGRAKRTFGQIVVFRDPPDHTRLRSLITPVFSARGAEAQRSAFTANITQMIGDIEAKGRMDFVSTIARLLPLHMICDVLGLPVEDVERLRSWVDAFVMMMEVDLSAEQEKIGDEAFADFTDYMTPVFEDRRREPRGDILSHFAEAQTAGQLSMDEVAAYALFLFVAGHESTTYLLANGLATLLTHPDQWKLFVSDPHRYKQGAVEEVLRFESSGRILFPRWASEDIELDGKLIEKGTMVIAANSAANRDPAMFEDPDRFDIQRANASRHLAFGFGAHLCSGAALARVEVQEVFAAVAERLPDLELAEDVRWQDTWILRAVESLDVTWSFRALGQPES